MKRVLLTAFAPFGPWMSNASWLCLQELTRELPESPRITTRLYPVDFAEARQRLESDLAAEYDFAIHLGQAAGASRLRLESIGLNFGGDCIGPGKPLAALEATGPTAMQVQLPLASWVAGLNAAGYPAELSYHAGTYLCNATLYWSLWLAEERRLATRSFFLHLPLEVSQTLEPSVTQPSMPASLTAGALRWLLAQLEPTELAFAS